MKRFYKSVSVDESDGGFRIMLDDRAIKTQSGNAQIVPTAALAQAMAAEWDGQPETIDPARLFFRDLADHAIDNIRPARGETLDKLLSFAETDTLCYRAEPGEALLRRQEEVWEPIVAALEHEADIRLERISGIMHRPQSQEALKKIGLRLDTADDFQLSSAQTMASLAASLTIAMAALKPGADGAALWDAANLEEDWQAELWGRDEEAEVQREHRRASFLDAQRFSMLAAAG